MTKIEYFRRRVKERYDKNELAAAAATGEALLSEHIGNASCAGMSYADDLYNLACVYDEMGHVGRATELYVESARLAYTEEGESPSFALRLNNLAALLSKTGRNESAYRLLKHVSAIQRECMHASSPELADSLYNLANAAADESLTDEALRLHNEALTLRKKNGSEEDIVSSLHSIALIHEAQDERAKAVGLAETALSHARGTNAYLGACYYLAGLYEAEEQYAKAEPLYREALRQVSSEGGRTHSAYVTVAARLANTLACMEEYRRALDTQREIRDILKIKAGESHLFYANCLRSMAILHKRLDESDEAETLMLQSLRIRKRVMGDDARDIVNDAVFLIDLYIAADKLDKALEALVFVLMQMGDDDLESMLSALTEVYSRGGHARFQAILREMEKLNDRGRLWEIVRSWNDWEHQDE